MSAEAPGAVLDPPVAPSDEQPPQVVADDLRNAPTDEFPIPELPERLPQGDVDADPAQDDRHGTDSSPSPVRSAPDDPEPRRPRGRDVEAEVESARELGAELGGQALQFVDMSSGVVSNARDAKEASINEQTKSRAGNVFKRFWNRVVIGNYGREAVGQYRYQKNVDQIVDENNIHAAQGGTEADHVATTDATVRRFGAEAAGELDLHAGETNERVSNTPYGAVFIKGLRELAGAYATGGYLPSEYAKLGPNDFTQEELRDASGNVLTDASGNVRYSNANDLKPEVAAKMTIVDDKVFHKELSRLTTEYRDAAGDIDRNDGLMVASNFATLGENMRTAHLHGEGLARLDKAAELNLAEADIHVGKAQMGVKDEARRTGTDKLLDKVYNSKVGAYISPFVSETTVSVAAGIVVAATQGLVTKSLTHAVTAAGLVGVGGGIAAGVKERYRMGTDRQTHARERTQGNYVQSRANDNRRMKLEKTLVDLEGGSAQDLMQRLDRSEFYQNDEGEDLAFDPDARGEDAARNVAIMQNTAQAIAEYKARKDLGGELNREFIGHGGTTAVDIQKYGLDLKLGAAERRLVSMLRSADDETLRRAGMTRPAPDAERRDVVDTTIASRMEEVTDGLEDDMTDKDRVFRSLRRREVMKAFGKGFVTSVLIGEAGSEIHAWASDAIQGVGESADGATSESVLVRIGQDLTHDAEAVKADVAQANLPTGTHVTAPTSVSEADYLQQHAHDGTLKTLHHTWEDNDTPAPNYDHNEEELGWGYGGKGTDGHGNYQMNATGMKSDGSWHNGKHVNAPAMVNHNETVLDVALDKEHNQWAEVPVGPNGEPIIPNGSPVASEFKTVDGHAKFVGGYAELDHVTGVNADGSENVQTMATVVGTNEHSNITVPGHIEANPPAVVVHPPTPDLLPVQTPVGAPIMGRKGLETLGKGEKDPELTPDSVERNRPEEDHEEAERAAEQARREREDEVNRRVEEARRNQERLDADRQLDLERQLAEAQRSANERGDLADQLYARAQAEADRRRELEEEVERLRAGGQTASEETDEEPVITPEETEEPAEGAGDLSDEQVRASIDRERSRRERELDEALERFVQQQEQAAAEAAAAETESETGRRTASADLIRRRSPSGPRPNLGYPQPFIRARTPFSPRSSR